MPRSHKPRKRYVPKRLIPNALGMVLDAVTVLDPTQRIKLHAEVGPALEAFRSGRATLDHWCALDVAMRVAHLIATDGTFVGDMPEAYADALAALQAVHARQQAGRGWTLRGPELVAIQRGLECHEA